MMSTLTDTTMSFLQHLEVLSTGWLLIQPHVFCNTRSAYSHVWCRQSSMTTDVHYMLLHVRVNRQHISFRKNPPSQGDSMPSLLMKTLPQKNNISLFPLEAYASWRHHATSSMGSLCFMRQHANFLRNASALRRRCVTAPGGSIYLGETTCYCF